MKIIDNNNTVNDFVYAPVQPFQHDIKKEESVFNIYVSKFKTSIYCFILFLLLSSTSAYKILDIVLKIFSKNLEVLEDDCAEPSLLGRVIMSAILSLVIFIL